MLSAQSGAVQKISPGAFALCGVRAAVLFESRLNVKNVRSHKKQNRDPASAVTILRGGARKRADDVFLSVRIKRRRSKANFAPTWYAGRDYESAD